MKLAEVTEHNINTKTVSEWVSIDHQGQAMSVWLLAVESPNHITFAEGLSTIEGRRKQVDLERSL